MATFTITKGEKSKTITASSCEVDESGKFIFKNGDGKVVTTVAGKAVESLKRTDSWANGGYVPGEAFARYVRGF